jgi:hypothetical protein
MCLFTDICCRVRWLLYTIQTHKNEAGFGQAQRIGRMCGTVEMLTEWWQSSNIRESFVRLFGTAAGSSDTWGYTWRRHNGDCAHQGYNGHWVFKIFGFCFLNGSVTNKYSLRLLPLLYSLNNWDNLKLRPSLSFVLLPFSILLRHSYFVFFFTY